MQQPRPSSPALARLERVTTSESDLIQAVRGCSDHELQVITAMAVLLAKRRAEAAPKAAVILLADPLRRFR